MRFANSGISVRPDINFSLYIISNITFALTYRKCIILNKTEFPTRYEHRRFTQFLNLIFSSPCNFLLQYLIRQSLNNIKRSSIIIGTISVIVFERPMQSLIYNGTPETFIWSIMWETEKWLILIIVFLQ